jgi:hypothetical protein
VNYNLIEESGSGESIPPGRYNMIRARAVGIILLQAMVIPAALSIVRVADAI